MTSQDRQDPDLLPIRSKSSGSNLQYRETREKYFIHVSKEKVMTLHDFMMSMDLDHHLHSLVRRKKNEIGNYIYYFNLETKSDSSSDKPILKWQLKKRYVDFVLLEKNLIKEMSLTKGFETTMLPKLVQFHKHHPGEGVPEMFIDAAESYLNKLLETPEIRQRSKILYDFIELSLLPTANGTQKYKEGYLRKRGGGRFKSNKLKLYISMLFKPWQKRWFLLTEEGITYSVDSSSYKPREMLLFDQTFQIEYGRKVTGHRVGISLRTPNRKLILQAYDLFEAILWIGEIQKAAKASPYTKIHRYLSYAPVRGPTNVCKWFVDSDGYFEELYNCLLQAKREVFITDWWLSPEISLKKPFQGEETRLDYVLGKIANEGVKVYIIVYREVKMIMYNDSEHTKRALEGKSPNITVLRHPSEPFFSWSHHEKMVVIDQQIGFVGGFDLCFGRSDTSEHLLFDPAEMQGKGQWFPGQDYTNPRLVDFRNIREYQTPLIDKNTTPRMPFHDAMIKLIGPVVADLCRHFLQYWNHVEVDVYGKGDEAPVLQKSIETHKTLDNEVTRDNTKEKFRTAFRKIFGIRPMTSVNKDLNEEFPEPKPLTLQKSQSTLPPATLNRLQSRPDSMQELATGDSLGSFHQLPENLHNIGFGPHLRSFSYVDPQTSHDFRVTTYNTKNNLATIPEQNAETNLQGDEEKDSGENSEKDDVLIIGKTNRAKEPRAMTKILDSMAFSASHPELSEPMNPFVKKAVLSLNSKREAKTLHHLKNPKAPPTAEEEQAYKKKYEDLLSNIKKKEVEFDEEIQNSQSREPEKRKHLTMIPQPVKATKLFEFAKRRENLKAKTVNLGSPAAGNKAVPKLLFQHGSRNLEGTCQCQMLRSAAKWSLGLKSGGGGIENSIQNAYIELIQNSKSFIYIENQFFMTGTAGRVVKNEIGQAILYRIEKAHFRREKFRVIVFLPLVPAFEGEVIDSKAALLRIQMHWQYMSISRGGESIYEQLRNKGIKPEDYIQFYSLRTHAIMPCGKPATEMIYIHSKIMIVDDDIVLIGSANINDRSLQGSRDSELAIVIEDSKKIKSYMDDIEVRVGEFACTFRRRLLAEHLGLPEDEVEDPLNDEFIVKMNTIAEQNTNIYREVFACYPDDSVKTLDELEAFSNTANPEKYLDYAPLIRGHLVWFPLDFLAQEQLKAPKSSMEYYIPDQTFV